MSFGHIKVPKQAVMYQPLVQVTITSQMRRKTEVPQAATMIYYPKVLEGNHIRQY